MLNSNLRYTKYTQLGRPYINLFQASLDYTRNEYKKKVDKDKKLLVEVIMRLLRNKKILKQAKERARKKALCLTLEIVEEGENVAVEDLNYPATLISIEFSPTIQSTIGLINTSITRHGTYDSTQ